MEKIIIKWRMIKEYPNIAYKIGQELTYNQKNNDYLKNWPEFWEPIYEEIGINLQNILNKERKYTGIYFTSEANGTTLLAMKEACKQTMELTIDEAYKHLINIEEPLNGAYISSMHVYIREKVLNQIK